MSAERESLRPIEGAARPDRRRLRLADELLLALLPTAAVLLVLAAVEALSRQRLLFASLASSAFLIYLDPRHGTNAVRTLVVAQLSAALLGLAAFLLLGPGYAAAGVGMVAAIVLMILLDAVHPPAVSTALSFALCAATRATSCCSVWRSACWPRWWCSSGRRSGRWPAPARGEGVPARDSHHPGAENISC